MSVGSKTDVLIIGAGIVGASCAAACAAVGWKSVVVANGICQGATAAGMGHITVMDDSDAQFALTRSGVELWHSMAPTLPAAAEFNVCGTLWLAADEEQLKFAEKRCRLYNQHGVRAQLIAPLELMELEPQLSCDLAGALLVHDDAVLYPPVATHYLLQKAQEKGSELVRGDVVQVDEAGVTLRDGRRLEARYVIVAAGNGSSTLVPNIGVRPRKGHLIITDRYPNFIRHQLIELGYLTSAHGNANESVAFNVQPRPGGQILIGSSRQFGTEDPVVEPHMINGIIASAQRYLPDIVHLNAIRCWTGFRPSTSDHLPIIGQSKNGVWYATGHEGLGITTAPASARLLVELMRGETPHISPEPYAADRFLSEVVCA